MSKRKTSKGLKEVEVSGDLRGFFHQRLEEAMERQRVNVAEETGAYLVELLSSYAHADRLFVEDRDGKLWQEPLAFILKRAVESSPKERVEELRRLGDNALYVSGFFPDSLRGKLVDSSYYVQMGGRAYDALSEMSLHSGARLVFRELASKFRHIAELFCEISEQAALGSDTGILELYERYIHTGSERLRLLLAQNGLLSLRMPREIQ